MSLELLSAIPAVMTPLDAGEPLESPRSVRPDTGYASLETDGLGAAAGGAADVAAAATAGALADGDDIAAAEFWSRGGH